MRKIIAYVIFIFLIIFESSIGQIFIVCRKCRHDLAAGVCGTLTFK